LKQNFFAEFRLKIKQLKEVSFFLFSVKQTPSYFIFHLLVTFLKSKRKKKNEYYIQKNSSF